MLWKCCNIFRDHVLVHGVVQVAQRLSVVEELAAVVSANLQRATRLRQSILLKAFSGRLLEARPKQTGSPPHLAGTIV